jgi:uncharacterized protein DUF6265
MGEFLEIAYCRMAMRGAYAMVRTAQTVLLALALSSPAVAQCGAKDAAFLAGTWQARDDNDVTEERWALLPSGQLMGSSWSMHPSRPGGFAEAETIVDEGGALTLRLRHFDLPLAHAREETDAPMVFVASSCSSDAIAFDGQGDRTGEHIAYRRDGDKLTFVGDFLHAGKPVHVEATTMRVGS